MDVARRITHVELLHAPGERLLAARVFELLGCTVTDSGGHREIVRRVRSCADDPELRGRVEVVGVFFHDAPDAIATNMDQAFIWTDVIASGPLRLGHVIEVQWHLEPEPTV